MYCNYNELEIVPNFNWKMFHYKVFLFKIKNYIKQFLKMTVCKTVGTFVISAFVFLLYPFKVDQKTEFLSNAMVKSDKSS